VLSGRFHPTAPKIYAVSTADQKLCINDLRNSAPCCELRQGISMGCIRWRPDQSTQIATTGWVQERTVKASGGMGWGLLVWDIRRPFVPLHQFNAHGDLMPDFLWADDKHLISCGKDSTVMLHSVFASHQPQSQMCCAGISWSLHPDATEALVLVSDSVKRDVEQSLDSDRSNAVKELAALMRHHGFEPEIMENTSQEKREHADQLLRMPPQQGRFCNHLAELPDSRSEDDKGLLQLMQLATFGQQFGLASAAERCSMQAETCKSAGLWARAQTWRLLAEVLVGSDEPPEKLMEQALLDDGQQQQQHRLTSRGPGASFSVASQAFLCGSASMHPSGSFDFSDAHTEQGSPIKQGKDTAAEKNLAAWQQDWQVGVLRHIVAFHEERNDVAMLLALVATLGLEMEPAETARRRVVRWTQGACDALTRMQAFVPRSALMRSTKLKAVERIAQRDTALYLRCAACKHNIEPVRGPLVVKPALKKSGAGGSAASSGKKATVGRVATCAGCHRRRNPPCAVCGEEVRGLLVACQICGHGGHLDHIRKWFESGNQHCPAGCGCICVSSSTSDEQKHSSGGL